MTGMVARIVSATVCSAKGLAAAFRHEAAFRADVLLAAVMIPTALAIDASGLEKAVMVASVLLVLVAELVNSAIEATLDRVSTEQHPLTGRAKDMGSAAVCISLVNVAAVWVLVLLA
jgi:diacylglycerol kinase (ATP)